MRRLAFLVVGTAVILAYGGSPALADNGPHKGFSWTAGQTYTFGDGTNSTSDVGTDRCASCHRAHTAKGEYLLKQAQPGLCFSCHGSTGTGATTDVVDGQGFAGSGTRSGAFGALRGGGFQFALINTANPAKTTYQYNPTTVRSKNQHIYTLVTNPNNVPSATTSTHSVDLSVQTAWGNGAVSGTTESYGAAVDLTCTSCHDPHGNKNYRILRSIPEESGATAGVTIPDVTATGGTGVYQYVTNDYWESGDFNTPAQDFTVNSYNSSGVLTPSIVKTDAFYGNIQAWCLTCHTRYDGGSKSYKTDSGDAVYKYKHRTDALKSISGGTEYPDVPLTTDSTGKNPGDTGYVTTYRSAGGGAANCITCHVSHGSNAAVGTVSASVTNPDGSAAFSNSVDPSTGATVTGTGGDSRLLRVDNRGVCLMCHNV